LTFETHVSQSKKANKTRELGADCDSLWNRGSTPKPLTAAIIVINNNIIDFDSIFRIFVGKLIWQRTCEDKRQLKKWGERPQDAAGRGAARNCSRERVVAKGWLLNGRDLTVLQNAASLQTGYKLAPWRAVTSLPAAHLNNVNRETCDTDRRGVRAVPT
jgi:hypothetical protein